MKSEGIRNNDRKEHLLLRDAPEVRYLQDIWNFYYLVPDKRGKPSRPWSEFITKLAAMASIEDIFATLQTVYEPKKLPKGCRYYIFKMYRDPKQKDLQEIEPLWECQANLGGWELFHEFPVVYGERPPEQRGRKGPQKGRRGDGPMPPAPMNNEVAEQRWRELILNVMCRVKAQSGGSRIPCLDKVNGMEFNCRGSVVKVGLWVAPSIRPEEKQQIKTALAEILQGEIKEDRIITEEQKHAMMGK